MHDSQSIDDITSQLDEWIGVESMLIPHGSSQFSGWRLGNVLYMPDEIQTDEIAGLEGYVFLTYECDCCGEVDSYPIYPGAISRINYNQIDLHLPMDDGIYQARIVKELPRWYSQLIGRS